MPVSRKRLSQKGFTLVELLIVVAIIGVLSTIGVPTFRKMIQKAKKSEAKVNLGGLYTAEQAFFSEYGLYGSDLNAIGFEVDGQQLIYAVGFLGANCAGLAVIPARPGATALQIALYTAFAAYNTAGTAITKVGNAVIANCTAAALPAGMLGTVNVINSTAGGDLDQFVASAHGVISPSIPAVGAAGREDVWYINHQRILANAQDGVGRVP